jgi:hypothetical protein
MSDKEIKIPKDPFKGFRESLLQGREGKFRRLTKTDKIQVGDLVVTNSTVKPVTESMLGKEITPKDVIMRISFNQSKRMVDFQL